MMTGQKVIPALLGVILIVVIPILGGCGMDVPLVPGGGGGPTLVSYYVDATTGNNASSGVLGSPFKTITKALNAASVSGANIYVAPGTYNAVNGEVFPLKLTNNINLIGDVANKGKGATPTTITGAGTPYSIAGGLHTAATIRSTIIIPPGVTASVQGFNIGGFDACMLVDGGRAAILSNTLDGVLGWSDGLWLLNGANAVVNNNSILGSGWWMGGTYIADATTTATFRNNVLNDNAGFAAVKISGAGAPVLDMGTASSSGGNTITVASTGALTAVGLNITAPEAASQTISVAGNTWMPNVQGADALGHYPATFVTAATPAVSGNNYARVAGGAASGIQFYQVSPQNINVRPHTKAG